MAVQLVAVAIQVGLPFLKKHPWIIPAAIVAPIIGSLLVFSLVFGLVQGAQMIFFPSSTDCPNGDTYDSALPYDAPEQIRNTAGKVTLCQPEAATPGDPNLPFNLLISPDGTWVRPSNGQVSDLFGWRESTGNIHSGVDITQPSGAPIWAASNGVVTRASWWGTCGNTMEVTHANGVTTRYCHIVQGGMLKNVGDVVKAGEQIARVGTTGGSTGNHLHFTVVVNGSLVDPLPFMRLHGIDLLDQGRGFGFGLYTGP